MKAIVGGFVVGMLFTASILLGIAAPIVRHAEEEGREIGRRETQSEVAEACERAARGCDRCWALADDLEGSLLDARAACQWSER
jgi:hypothetical protein